MRLQHPRYQKSWLLVPKTGRFGFDFGAFTLGLSRGLIICPPLIALLDLFIAFCQSAWKCMELAVLFGLGTAHLAILLLGGVTGWLLNKAPLFRKWISIAGGTVLIVLGIIHYGKFSNSITLIGGRNDGFGNPWRRIEAHGACGTWGSRDTGYSDLEEEPVYTGNFSQVCYPSSFLCSHILRTSPTQFPLLYVINCPLCDVTLFLGRFFCGWLCPFAFIMDIESLVRKALKIRHRIIPDKLNRVLHQSRYVILLFFLLLPIVLWFLDPQPDHDFAVLMAQLLAGPFRPYSILLDPLIPFIVPWTTAPLIVNGVNFTYPYVQDIHHLCRSKHWSNSSHCICRFNVGGFILYSGVFGAVSAPQAPHWQL